MVEDAGDGGGPLLGGVLGGRPVAGVLVHEVVPGRAAVLDVAQQMDPLGQPQQVGQATFAGPGGSGGSRDRPAGARQDAQRAEGPPRLVRQHPVRQVEGGPYGDGLLALDVQPGQTPPVREVTDVSPDTAWPVADPGARDAQGERQTVAEFDEACRGLRIGGDGLRADGAADQFQCRGAVEDVAGHPVGPVQGDQAAQLVPARHQRQRAGRGGQQPPYGRRVGHVVEDDEHPAVHQQRPVQRGLRLGAQRDVARGAAQSLEEQRQGLTGGHRLGVVEAPHVQEELAVGEAVGHPVGPVQR